MRLARKRTLAPGTVKQLTIRDMNYQVYRQVKMESVRLGINVGQLIELALIAYLEKEGKP